MKVKVALDPGHGMSNTKPRVFDPGAVSGQWRECDLTLKIVLTCKFVFAEEGIPFFLTRSDNTTPAPLKTRAIRAMNAGCTHLISFHLNSADGYAAGIETYYSNDKAFAGVVHAKALKAFDGENRGVKSESESQHDRLAILRGNLISCLCEAGFINNPVDVAAANNRDRRIELAEALAEYFKGLRDA